MAKLLTTNLIFILVVVCVIGLFFYHLTSLYTKIQCDESLLEKDEKITALTNQLEEMKKDNYNFNFNNNNYNNNNNNNNIYGFNKTNTNTDQHTNINTDDSDMNRYTDSSDTDSSMVVLPVLVMACNRPANLKATLTHLLKHRGSQERFPIFVSLGCGDVSVAELVRDEFGDSVIALTHYKVQEKPYFAIARHYGWALRQLFDKLYYDAVIVVEDDMEVSVDFFEYFAATYPLLMGDPTIYCVSSWNDNGLDKFVDDDTALHRTDVFPGLGWMLSKELWSEIRDVWPTEYWDEFMRDPRIRKDRVCIWPEISRNQNIGSAGASDGLFWRTHIQYIHTNKKFVPFTTMDLSYLLKDNYDAWLSETVTNATVVTDDDVLLRNSDYNGKNLRIVYNGIIDYIAKAKKIGLMPDEKLGMPRTSYKMIVPFKYGGKQVFLTPSDVKL